MSRRSSLQQSSIDSFAHASSRRDESPVTSDVVMGDASDDEESPPAAASARRPRRAAATAALTALHRMHDKQDVVDAEESKSSTAAVDPDDDVPLLHLLTPQKRRRVASADSTSSDTDSEHDADSDYDGDDAPRKCVSMPITKSLFGHRRRSHVRDVAVVGDVAASAGSDDVEEKQSEVKETTKKTTKQKNKPAAVIPAPMSPLMSELISCIESADAASHLRTLAACMLLELPDSLGAGVIDLNRQSSLTGDTLLQSIYVLARARGVRHVSQGATMSLLEHKDRLVHLIGSANLRLRNHAGQTILHTICHTGPSESESNSRHRLFEVILEECVKSRLSFLTADEAGHVPIVDLARLVSANKFKMSRFTKVLRALDHRADLSVADANGDRAAHFLCRLAPGTLTRGELWDFVSLLNFILNRSQMVMQMDLYEQTSSGQTVIEIVRESCARNPVWGNVPHSLRAMPRQLEDQFCLLAKPTYKRRVAAHLIPDLADIVVAYLVPTVSTHAPSAAAVPPPTPPAASSNWHWE